jgi:hypothetical protein
MRITFLQRERADRLALSAATLCTLLLPVALLHARALAEILIAMTDALFLVHLWVEEIWAPENRAWLRSRLLWAACLWCLWQIVCSVFGTGGLGLALVLFRLPLLAAALGSWVLVWPRTRRWLWWMLAAAALWITVEAWQQYALGTNLFGVPRWGDGALTGPFNRPRAGPALILILFPVMLPAAAALLACHDWPRKIGGVLIAVLGAATVLLIGQRMPSALLLLGLGLAGLLLPRLRIAAGLAVLIGVGLLAATPVVAPATYQKLIVRTQEQLTNFVYSPYGELWVRAAVLAQQHPVTGLGFDGFRRGCGDPHAVQGLPLLGVTLAEARIATDACNIHPHNYYLEQADNGGVPLLLLFCGMVALAGARLASGIRRGFDPLRAGLLVAFTVALWPFASTSGFTAMPNAGWIFLLAGFGLAEAAQASPVVR